jgi:hypothetical protein
MELKPQNALKIFSWEFCHVINKFVLKKLRKFAENWSKSTFSRGTQTKKTFLIPTKVHKTTKILPQIVP